MGELIKPYGEFFQQCLRNQDFHQQWKELWYVPGVFLANLYRQKATIKPQNIGLKTAEAKTLFFAHGCLMVLLIGSGQS